MTLAAKTTVALVVAALIVPHAAAQSLIPPPGAPQPAYFIEFSDSTTYPAQPQDSPSQVTSHAWQAQAADPSFVTPAPAAIAAAVPTISPTAIPAPMPAAPALGDVGPGFIGATGSPPPLWAEGWEGSGPVACDASCDGAACETCPFWSHRSGVFASVLYLRPRNLDVAYAVPIDGPIGSPPASNPVQIGGVGVIDHDYETGFDAGVNLAINGMTSVYAQVMMLDASTTDRLRTAAPDVLRSIVAHPSSTSAATDFLTASADLGLELETVNLGLRHLVVGGDVFAVNSLVGARYGRLEQTFDSMFVDNGTERVATDIDFDGGGLTLGWDAERRSCGSGLRVYSRGAASFLAGRFRASYFQGQSFDPTVVDTHWEAGRVVPVLDLELGAGWASTGGRLRLSAGYLVSAWFNTVQTDDFIRAVQANRFDDLGGTLTLDGLRAEAEWRF